MTVKPIPEGFHSITPYLLVEGVDELVGFLQRGFDAEARQRLERPDGSVMHVELRIGDSMLMLGEPMGEFGPMPSSIYLYVEDCDSVYRRALEAGGTSVMEVTHMYHAGERYGGVQDPSGNIWWIATHVEDVPPEEQKRRVRETADKWERGGN